MASNNEIEVKNNGSLGGKVELAAVDASLASKVHKFRESETWRQVHPSCHLSLLTLTAKPTQIGN